MKLRRSLLGRYVNRETEQNLLNLICSFMTYEVGSGSTRLHVFIRKNRYMGAIYVEYFAKDRPSRVICRSLFNKSKWKQNMSPDTTMALRHLRSAELYSIAAGCPLDMVNVMEHLIAGCQRLSL